MSRKRATYFATVEQKTETVMNIKTTIAAFAATALATVAQAQEQNIYVASQSEDTLTTNVDMAEIRVQAADMIHKVGSDTYMPTKEQKALAINAIALLDKMQVKGLVVNTVFNTVESANGGKVIYLINGREVSLNDIITLSSSSILRVESDMNPGGRHADASVVLNFVLKKREQGGDIFVDGLEALNTRWGNNTISGKYNNGESEWSANYHVVHAKFKQFYNENEESYVMEDGQRITQEEEGVPGRLKYAHHFVTANYNYMKGNDWMMNVAYKGRYDRTPNSHLDSRLSNPNYGKEPVDLKNRWSDNSSSSSLDLYLQKKIGEERLLLFNAVGTLISSDYNNYYNIASGNNEIYTHSTVIDGKKRSLIGEAMYEQNIGDNRITFGAKETLGHTDNDYNGLKTTRLEQSNTYIYAQWTHKGEKVNLGIGGGADVVHFSQGDVDYTHTFFRPMVKIAYNPNEKTSLTYKATIEAKSPTLSELSDVTTSADNYLKKRGNPDLKAATDIIQKIDMDFHPSKSFSTSVNVQYTSRRNPVMETFGREGESFVSSYSNGKRWNYLNAEWGTRMQVLYGMFSMHSALGVDHYMSEGNDYRHEKTNVYLTGGATIAYYFIALSFDIKTHRPSLYGETMQLGEDLHDIALTYFKKGLQVSLIMNNPFMDNYKIGYERYSDIMPAKEYQYVNETSKMILGRISYNLDFGSKRKSIRQRLNNEDTDNGMVKGK